MNPATACPEFLKLLLAAEPLPGRRVLLYGASGASLCNWLAAEGAEVAVLSASRDTVLSSLHHARAAGVERRVRAIESSTAQLPMFADLAFDILVLLPGQPFLLHELARILRPGARLISAVPLDPASVRPHFTSLRRHRPGSRFRLPLPWARPAPTLWTARRPSAS
jgi:SAM-dependent methyltransferase